MDIIANFIIALKNASMADRKSVTVPYSKIKFEIANLLLKKGFIGQISKKGKKNRSLEVIILYKNDSPRITDVKRISKPSRRMYLGFKEIYLFKQGFGMTVFSTSKGVMSDMDAKKEKLGGEALFAIW